MSQFNTVLEKRQFSKGIHYELAHFISACKIVGDPHECLGTIIHIAGTNGKGSTAHYVSTLLIDAGYKVGVFSSPHFRHYSERIKINHHCIAKSEFDTRLQTLLDTPEFNELTEFELITLLGFCYFRDHAVDFCVLETGLGGRLDATNVVSKSLSIITPIDLDHQSILGDDICSIAYEKAGIIKPNSHAFSADQTEAVAKVLKQAASKKQANLNLITVPQEWRSLLPDLPFYLQDNSFLAFKALLDASYISLSPEDAARCLYRTSCLGRFTTIRYGKGQLVLDSAHNPAAIRSLIQAVKTQFSTQSITFILGVQDTKPAEEMIALIQEAGWDVKYCYFDKNRSKHLCSSCAEVPILSWPFPLPTTGITVFTGSIYFLGDILRKYPELLQDYSTL